MTRLRIVTWNAEGMFVEGTKTRRATPHDALAALKKLDADVVVIPEFGRQGALHESVRNTIGSLGYQLVEVPYEDKTIIPYDLEMAIVSRYPISVTTVHRFADMRNATEVRVKVNDRLVRIIGVHLDDKTEETRLLQAEDLVEQLKKEVHMPTLLLGDFNAMRRVSKFARVSRSAAAKSLSRLIRHDQLSNIATRLHEMALGTTIEYIEKHTSLHNLDPRHTLSISGRQAGLEWVPSVRLAKIDWIFGSHHFKVVRYHAFHDVGSDHRPIVADLDF